MAARWLILVVTAGAFFMGTGSADARYRGRRGGGGGANPGSILVGMGKFNLLTSQAAINYQQAYSKALENRLKAEQTYFEARKGSASARAAMRASYSPEQYAADNQARIAGRLSPSEWNPGLGVFVWPHSLAGDGFANDRDQIEALFGARDADPSAAGLGTANYRQIKQAVTEMSDHLHSQIDEMSPDEFLPASKFLKSLEYEARFASGAEVVSTK
jgi:hypothetical protein